MPNSTTMDRVTQVAVDYLWYHHRRTTVKTAILCLSLLASLFSILQVSECSFMETRSTRQGQIFLSKAGLFTYATYDTNGDKLGCLSYAGQVQFDAMFRAGRAFGTVTALYSVATLILVLFSLAFCPQKYTSYIWNVARSLVVCATVTQMFTFFVLGSENCDAHDCTISSVGVLAVFDIFVLAGMSVIMVLEPPPTEPWFVLWSNDQYYTKESLAVDCGEFTHSQGQNDQHSSSNSMNANDGSSTFNLADQFVDMECDSGSSNNQAVHRQTTTPITTATSASVSSQKSAHESLADTMGIHHVTSFRLALFLVVLLSWIFSIVGVQHCSFILVGSKENDRTSFSGLGLYSRAVYHDGNIIGCVAYPAKDVFDSAFSSARVFGVVAVLLMTVVLILFTLQLVVNLAKEEIWFGVRSLIPCAIVAQLLAFVVFGTSVCSSDDNETECLPGSASVLSMLNIFVMLLLCTAVYLLPPPPNVVFARFRKNAYEEDNASSVGNVGDSSRSLVYVPELKRQSSKLSRIMECSREGSFDDDEDDDTDTESSDIDINNTYPTTLKRIKSDPEETIRVHIVYNKGERKTIKEIIHPDGSKTITTRIEELSDTESDAGSVHSEPDAGAMVPFKRDFVANPVASILKPAKCYKPAAERLLELQRVDGISPPASPASHPQHSTAAVTPRDSVSLPDLVERKVNSSSHVSFARTDEEESQHSSNSRDPDGMLCSQPSMDEASVCSKPAVGTVAERLRMFQK